MTASLPKLLIVFDFDWSFIDQDCDYWLLECLSPALRQKLEVSGAIGAGVWTDAVAECLDLLWEEGHTPSEILDTLRAVPLHPAMKRAVRSLKSREGRETSFLLLSNANELFINTILTYHGLESHFKEIISNPAHFNPAGKIELHRRIDPITGTRHSCALECEANMCKGDELDKYVEKNGGWENFDRVVYVGDGFNDLCPVLRLRSQDLVCPRKGRSLEGLIKARGEELGLKCSVEGWEEAWQLERIFDRF